MKKKLANIAYILIVVFALSKVVPRLISNFKNEGLPLQPGNYRILASGKAQSLQFPNSSSNAVVIFWATWCGPCKIEMNRLKSSVENGKIPSDKIIAINPFETGPVVDKFIMQEKYPFTFIDAAPITKQLKIIATPTMLFVENGIVTSMKTGLSFIAIWQAENLFN